MALAHLTNRSLSTIVPSGKPYFIRDTTLRGLGVKVSPKGKITFVVEIWCGNSSTRKTIGEFPFMPIQEARKEALQMISDIKVRGTEALSTSKEIDLESLFNLYLKSRRLKPSTERDYKEVLRFYLGDWRKRPIQSITKKMIEKRFITIRDIGVQGGKPTHSQAAKTMRILSALMNYAKGDELIDVNPVEVLKLKKVDTSIPQRKRYLRTPEVRSLLSVTDHETHPGVLAVLLMLHTGLRKNEALSIRWEHLVEIEGVSVINIPDPKNSRTHYIPITPLIENIIARATNKTPCIFPSPAKKNAHISDLRDCIARLVDLIGAPFTSHDLRRTFATRASEVGIDYLMIKRLLNHKTNDITARYIQWDSKKNLEAMRDALMRVQWLD